MLPGLPMIETINQFLDQMRYRKGFAQSTISAYHADITYLCAFLHKRHISSWSQTTYALLLDAISDLGERDYAQSSIARFTASWHSFFQWLYIKGLHHVDPSAKIIIRNQSRRLPKIIQEHPLIELIEMVPFDSGEHTRNRLILELLYSCGLRVSELTSLAIGNINWVDQLILIKGKGNKERQVPFGEHALDAMGRWLPYREQIVKQAKGALRQRNQLPGAPLLIGPRGGQMSRATVAQIVHETIHAHLPEGSEATPHTLRHAFATHLLQHGAPINEIQELLGHASISTTQIYTHVDEAAIAEIHRKFHPRG